MAEETTTLDVNWLKSFIKDHIEEFQAELEKIQKKDSDGVPALDDLGGTEDPNATHAIIAPGPLRIGLMGGGEGGGDISGKDMGGVELNQQLNDGATNIADILKEQEFLFQDIKDALEATIEELTGTQSTNLDSMSVEDFMDIFEDVDLATSGGGGASSGGGGAEASS